MKSQLITSILLSLLTSRATALPASTKAQSVALLLTSPSALDRINLLSDADFLFDFFNPTPDEIGSSGKDGRTVQATQATFPALVGSNVAMTVGFLGPCGLNTPHTHPRATEFNIAINGTLRTGMLAENNARVVTNMLQPGQATVFPRGAIHFEQNLGCEPVMFVAAFDGVDPGVSQVADRFFGLPTDIVQATLGDIGATEVQGLASAIPKNVIYGVESCLQKCGSKNPS
jgi:hypothetical protein